MLSSMLYLICTLFEFDILIICLSHTYNHRGTAVVSFTLGTLLLPVSTCSFGNPSLRCSHWLLAVSPLWLFWNNIHWSLLTGQQVRLSWQPYSKLRFSAHMPPIVCCGEEPACLHQKFCVLSFRGADIRVERSLDHIQYKVIIRNYSTWCVRFFD